MIEWINNNKEWFFSGLGIFLLTIVGGIIKFMFFKNRKHSKRTINFGGDKSVYVEKNEGSINIK
nr:hypothetical protein [uncultured Macellibacteroides sp.]